MRVIPGTDQCSHFSVPQPRLVKAACEFEAQLMKELLQPLTAAGDDSDEMGSQGALGDFAAEALGQSLSRSGGFGIGASILRGLSRNGDERTCGIGKRIESSQVGTELK